MLEPPVATLGWVRASLGRGSRLLALEPLRGDLSHTNHRLRVETATGSHRDLLLRRYTNAELLASDRWYSPSDELDAIRTLDEVELPVPRLVAEDVTATRCDVPTLLLTWLPGGPVGAPDDLDAFARRLAEPLPVIHGIDPPPSMRRYEPYFVSDGLSVVDLRPPPWAFDVRTWERAFEIVALGAPDDDVRFIHRDYHHGNTVWMDGRLTGVVDWTTGCAGPAGIDLAHARLNLTWDHGPEAADAFVRAWKALGAEIDVHPYWEVLDTVDWLGDGAPEPRTDRARLRRYEASVAQAVARFG